MKKENSSGRYRVVAKRKTMKKIKKALMKKNKNRKAVMIIWMFKFKVKRMILYGQNKKKVDNKLKQMKLRLARD